MANLSAVFNQEDMEEQIQTRNWNEQQIVSVDYIAANVSSLPTHTPQVKFLSLEVKKEKPNLPL